MALNYKQLLIFGVVSSLLTFLFVGQFYDHHGDRTLFIKNRPTFRQLFILPPKNPVPAASQDAEKKAEENESFILKQMERESEGALFIASILIETSLMLLISGCFSFLKKTSFFPLQLIIQLSINFLIVFFALSLMLFIDDATTSFIFFITLGITNYFTIIIYNIFDNHSKKNKFEICS
jgi:hypothetical protein